MTGRLLWLPFASFVSGTRLEYPRNRQWRIRNAYPQRVQSAGHSRRCLTSGFAPAGAGGGDRKIGYCIIGLGRISMGRFMPGVLASKNSRSPDW